ncbi:alkylated DNA nucleotide flippase Atl1 [Arthrobacter silviterrae]|uniref:Cysteine methyltransferase n=1 Tax=Arthrobacter silviterrae TaxID=2026658 RepID=A0ABX0DED4_9MICC|nr:MGMT family protein [Arthrobacter silviterrae]MDQ0277185.1 alkylated DNA nucleotide flippase Atl1 [Arthrobacter silviterrae]NGN83739.1 cysteine methyltransferase [Arthrobacter silviterrae]
MRAEYVEAVLDVVELIPAGQVLSYGDIAALLESGGPRQVGSVMSHHGSAVPWWRVIRAAGLPPVCHDATALVHYREEATALRGETGGEHPSWRVDMALARWNPNEPEFDAIDAIAARLHAAVGPAAAPEAGPAAKMSVPRDGLQA